MFNIDVDECQRCATVLPTIILNLPWPQLWCMNCIEAVIMRDQAHMFGVQSETQQPETHHIPDGRPKSYRELGQI